MRGQETKGPATQAPGQADERKQAAAQPPPAAGLDRGQRVGALPQPGALGLGRERLALALPQLGLASIQRRLELPRVVLANLERAAAHGEYLVVLQDDTVVHPGWLESLAAVADAHPEAGVVCSAGLYPGGGTVQTAGVVLFSDATATHVREGEPVAALEALEPYAADSCSSAGMLVRARTWDAVGGLDDRFFPLYFVDATLTMRVWERGEAVLCAPRARVEHARSQSTSSRFKDYLFPRHRRVFEDRWRDVLDAREAELREREREALAAESERAWLRERSDTLAAIQAGGWWRLRGRLLPLIRLAGRRRGRRV